jgi:hypothetical protein
VHETLVLPAETLVLPAETLVLPAETLVLPAETLVLPAETLVLPAETLVLPADSQMSNDTTTQLLNEEHDEEKTVLSMSQLSLLETEADTETPTTTTTTSTEKIPKKRGRKPKGGKIIITNCLPECPPLPEPNIILHLKCGSADLTETTFATILDCGIGNRGGGAVVGGQGIDNFQFERTHLQYQELPGVIKHLPNDTDDENESNATDSSKNNSNRVLWKKIRELTYNLHCNTIADKKSACFWCTCDFDNPPIFLPKHEINGTYYCYGCFCSPECATAYLLKEPIDTSTRFERYHLLNHIYCKIYEYKKNIKPAPDPYYTLTKYYGNLSIQEYRRLLKSERLLLVVDKPLSRTLPELHEDNDDFMSSGNTIPPASKFKLRRKAKQTKSDIMSESFNFEGNSK